MTFVRVSLRIIFLVLPAALCLSLSTGHCADIPAEKAILENNTGTILDIDLKTGVYRVSHNGRVWVGDGLVAMRLKDRMLLNVKPDGSPSDDMKLTRHTKGGGTGPSGDYSTIKLLWETPGLKFETKFKLYNEVSQVEFAHNFPDGYKAENTSKFEDTALNFPVFVAGDGGADLHLFSYGYPIWPYPIFGKNIVKTFNAWGNTANRTPLLIFDGEGKTGVLSPFNDYMIRIVRILDLTSQGFGPAVAVGTNGELERLGPGHASRSILHFNDKGVAAAMYSWGAELMKAVGKEPIAKDETFFLRHLGYWTDNGAYYYYRTETGKNYETTLLEMGEYLKREKIPVRLFQLDSWWYPKSEKDGGVLVWKPIAEMFPDGLTAFQRKLGLPLTFHNRYFAVDTPYQERMPFVKGSGGTHPLSGAIFEIWAESVKEWGGIMYEQDWLGTQMGKVEALRRDPHLASQWLNNMAGAMERAGLEIQYCMPTIGFYLESTRFQNVTNIRSSNDYFVRLGGQSQQLWWEHVYTSPLIHALGSYPFKDVIITRPPDEKIKSPMQERFSGSTGERREEDITLFEPYYHHSALLSILSAGPVGIGDRIGDVNKPVIMLMADEDGVLVKPDHPLIPIDRMFYKDPLIMPESLIGYTSSAVSGKTWYYVLALNTNQAMTKSKFLLTPGDLSLQGGYVAYDFLAEKALPLDRDFSIERKLKPTGIFYLVLAPLTAQGRALIGDVGKYVTASDERILYWEDSKDGMEIDLNGPEGSATKLLVYSESEPKKVTAVSGGIEIKKAENLIRALGDAKIWAKTGENLYTIVLNGGAGEQVKIEF
ncbi:MAG: hypothetical protein ABIH66_01150 [bacterium]